MNGLSLFTGSGIGDLAFQTIIPGYRTVCYVENNPSCVAHLIKSIKDGLIDDAPIWDDIRTLNTTPYPGMVDIIAGGFPCQPFSVAGKNKGADDERNCWPETFRVISNIRPRYAFLENVPALITNEYIRRIFGDLASIGYDCEWDIVSAAFVGAPHLRKRLWILPYSDPRCGIGDSREEQSRRSERSNLDRRSARPNVADSERSRQSQSQGNVQELGRRTVNGCEDGGHSTSNPSETQRQIQEGKDSNAGRDGWWSVEPSVGRVVNGLAGWVDRLKMLGNGQVPQCISRILKVQRGR